MIVHQRFADRCQIAMSTRGKLRDLSNDAARHLGLIGLDIDDNEFGWLISRAYRFGDPIGTGAVSAGSHTRNGAELRRSLHDAFVVSCNDNFLCAAFARAFVYVLDQRLATHLQQRFTR